MALRIGNNEGAATAARFLSRNNEDMQKSFQRLASGNQVVSAGDDPAGFAISEKLRGDESGLMQAQRNADGAVGLIQVAEGGLSEQNNIVVRMREIAVQAASDTVNDDERDFLNTEFQTLIAENDRIANSTRYGQTQLLSGKSQNFEFFVGNSGDPSADVISYKLDANTRSSALGLSGLGVNDKGDAQGALEDLDSSLTKLNGTRAGLGAIQGRLQIASNNLGIQRQNIGEARSRIADVDIASESTKLARAQVLQEANIAILAQANQSPFRVMKLL